MNRSAIVQFQNMETFDQALLHASMLFDALWRCTPDTRPFNITIARAQPHPKGETWDIVVEAEDA